MMAALWRKHRTDIIEELTGLEKQAHQMYQGSSNVIAAQKIGYQAAPSTSDQPFDPTMSSLTPEHKGGDEVPDVEQQAQRV